MSKGNPEYVMREMCSTCIFRPGNPMHLRRGRLTDLIMQCDAADTNVICHKSANVGGDIEVDAWCRGSVDRRPGQMVRILERLRLLQEVEEGMPHEP